MGESLKKYYIRRPLRYLQNIFYSLFFVNGFGYAWLEFIHDYHHIGWLYGLFTAPAAGSCLALMLGYNLSFWIVRQAFHLHIPLSEIPTTFIYYDSICSPCGYSLLSQPDIFLQNVCNVSHY